MSKGLGISRNKRPDEISRAHLLQEIVVVLRLEEDIVSQQLLTRGDRARLKSIGCRGHNPGVSRGEVVFVGGNEGRIKADRPGDGGVASSNVFKDKSVQCTSHLAANPFKKDIPKRRVFRGCVDAVDQVDDPSFAVHACVTPRCSILWPVNGPVGLIRNSLKCQVMRRFASSCRQQVPPPTSLKRMM